MSSDSNPAFAKTLTRAISRLGLSTNLPPELQGRAVHRLRTLCWVLGALAATYSVIVVLVRTGVIDVTHIKSAAEVARMSVRVAGVMGAMMLLAGVVLAGTYRPKLSSGRLTALGLLLEIGGALGIASAEHLRQMPPDIFGISFVCVWIMTFNLVPMTARRAALGAFAAAAMGPVGLAINTVWADRPWPPGSTMFLHFFGNFVAATISVTIAAMVHRLGAYVTRARRLGSYKLVERLGQGGMGEVWRAEHESLIRPAAIKLIRQDLPAAQSGTDGDLLLRRFRREVQVTALLQSPHTVAVYDFGRAADGTLYYVMELLRGMDLDRLVTRFGPLPVERVIHVITQACHSLADAHRHGLVHRDLKPANLHLCALGLENDFVKVLDFGLARHLQLGGDSRLSVAGGVLGTPACMAPETVLRGEADARSDLYALGCVAYWLLTGNMVFNETRAVTMMAAHAHTLPDPPSRRTELPIPPELDAIVLSLLAKDPADRPQSALELVRLLAEVPVASPWTQERADRWWQTHLPQLLRQTTIEAENVALASA